MPTQNVNLTNELESFVKKQVASGFYNNASEVHRAALASMAQREEERQLKLELLRREIQLGIDDVEAGRIADIQDDESLHSMLDDSLESAMHRFEQA